MKFAFTSTLFAALTLFSGCTPHEDTVAGTYQLVTWENKAVPFSMDGEGIVSGNIVLEEDSTFVISMECEGVSNPADCQDLNGLYEVLQNPESGNMGGFWELSLNMGMGARDITAVIASGSLTVQQNGQAMAVYRRE